MFVINHLDSLLCFAVCQVNSESAWPFVLSFTSHSSVTDLSTDTNCSSDRYVLGTFLFFNFVPVFDVLYCQIKCVYIRAVFCLIPLLSGSSCSAIIIHQQMIHCTSSTERERDRVSCVVDKCGRMSYVYDIAVQPTVCRGSQYLRKYCFNFTFV